jgi:hypothetical protein
MRLAPAMLKVVRITGWVLLVLLIVQFTTVAIFESLLPRGWLPIRPLELHEITGLTIGAVAVVHIIAAIYLAVRRWTWKSRHLPT